MGPSLIILLIVVVWVIVLAPLVLGDNKPIRRSGEGYEETRVLHEGGTAPMATRRRPKLTAADVHRYNAADNEDYEVVDAVADEERVLIDDTKSGLKPLFAKRHTADTEAAGSSVAVKVIEGTEEETAAAAEGAATEEPAAEGGSTAYSVLTSSETAKTEPEAAAEAAADANVATAAHAEAEAGAGAEAGAAEDGEDEETAAYEAPESYLAPSDFGFDGEDAEDAEGAELADEADSHGAAADDAEGKDGAEETLEAKEAELDTETELDAAEGEAASSEPTEEDIAFAQSRRGRGGWDPQRDARNRADRYKRRQRTFAGLIVASVISLVVATMYGGWVWILPAVTVGLTVWFLVALRKLVKKERALRARRMRQLRRARLGVDTQERPLRDERHRAGSVILDVDDESPDFDHLPRYRQPVADHGYNPGEDRELPRYDRAS